MKSFVAQVRCQINNSGATTLRFAFQCDSDTGARTLMSSLFGRSNVINVRQVVGEEVTHPLSATELQVKALDDKAVQLKQQAKLAKARNRVNKAQNQLSKVNKATM